MALTDTPAPDDHTPGYHVARSTADVLKRLRRIEGQVRGIHGMVDEQRYCIDVLQQVSAVQAALDKVALALVEDHTRHCLLDADPATRDQRHAELITTLARMVGRR